MKPVKVIAYIAMGFLPLHSVCGGDPGDWPMLGRTSARNPVVPDGIAPVSWDIKSGRNIRWSTKLGSQTYGTPVIANGQLYVGTNNGAGYLKRYPADVDRGCLLCFRESDGSFLWQFSAGKLPQGRVADWPMQGIGCPPFVAGERMWFVSNRWEVVCLDTQGFRDNQNDGPFDDERDNGPQDADIIWKFDMIGELDMFPHCAGMGPDRRCSVATWGNNIYVVTGNGVDESHRNLPTPRAPSLICLDRNSGELRWTDNSPGENILHTQISSPLVAEIDGRLQVIVPQGDGWLRSFEPETGKLLWKFDMNTKHSEWVLGGRGNRNNVLAAPVLYENRIYIASGQEMEHGEGPGRLVCIDPTKDGDISSELAVDTNGKTVPHRRGQVIDPDNDRGEKAIENPNSGLIWEFVNEGEEFEDTMHRMISTVAVHNGLVVAADGAGLVHCLSARTGERYWAYDVLAAIWSAPLIVGETVYVPDEDGKVNVFRLSADPKRAMKFGESGLAFVRGEQQDLVPIAEVQLDSSVNSSPVFANGVLYVADRSMLYAIAEKDAVTASRPKQEQIRSSRGPSGSKRDTNRIPKSAYVPTPSDIVQHMLELAGVTKKDTVCDLGSGDGRIPIAAATQFGANGIGYELNAELIRKSRRMAAAAGVADRVTFHRDNLFNADLSEIDVLTLYLYPVQNRRLIPQLNNLRSGVRIVTHRYELPGIRVHETKRVKSSTSGETHTLYRYTTPLQSADSQE